MITVRFYGDLAQYGRRFDLHADTPAEALHALYSQIAGLRQHIQKGVYQVRWKKQDQSEDTIQDDFKRPDTGVLHIVPRVAGAGKATNIIIGVVLIVASWYAGGAAGWAYLGAQGYTMATTAFMMGASMIMSGVAQMLTKQPSLGGGGTEGSDTTKNTAFSNLDNTAAQGLPMPLAYGLCYCGSRVVSQGVETRRLATGSTTTVSKSSSPFKKAAKAVVTTTPAKAADPLAVNVSLGIKKTFTTGVAATAPNGQKYNTDFENDSVRAQNYVAEYTAT